MLHLLFKTWENSFLSLYRCGRMISNMCSSQAVGYTFSPTKPHEASAKNVAKLMPNIRVVHHTSEDEQIMRRTIHGNTIIIRLTNEPPRIVISWTTLRKARESIIGIRTRVTPTISCSRVARIFGSVAGPRSRRWTAVGSFLKSCMFSTDSRIGKTFSGMAMVREKASPKRTAVKNGSSWPYSVTMFGAVRSLAPNVK